MPSDASLSHAARVVAVIAVFHAPADLFDRVDALLPQVGSIILVDDGSASVDREVLKTRSEVRLIDQADNGGIARALNAGCVYAQSMGAEFVLTLDQDSTVPEGFVEALINVYESASAAGVRPGLAVPGRVGGAAILREKATKFGFPIAFDPIQSGSLIPVSLWKELGGFDEGLFIDAVDSEFTLKCRTADRLPVIADDLSLGHALGELIPLTAFGKPVRWRGRDLHVLYHSPFRTYYMVRNSVYLARSDRRPENRAWWRLRHRKLALMIIGALAFGPQKGAQLRAVRWGISDGRRKRLGKIDPDLLEVIRGSESTQAVGGGASG